MNKKKIITPLFFAATFLLASCSTSTIVARPTWQNDPIIEDTTGSLKDNKMKSIYDAIKTLGDTNANVLNQVLYNIATTNLGTYQELAKYSTANASDPELKSFIDKHKCYQPKDKIGYYKEGTETKSRELTDDEYIKVCQNLIKQQYEQLQLEVYDKLYDELKGSEFVTDNLFYEERFIMNLRKNMYDILKPTDIANLHNNKRIINKPVQLANEETKVFLERYKKFLTDNYLNLNVKFKPSGKTEEQGIYDDYIERKIFPDLFRNYLIQNYVNEQRYSNLGRSYARKVNMITIPAASGSAARANIRAMLNEFAKNSLKESQTGETSYNFDFSIIENALIGNVGSSESKSSAEKLLVAGGFETIKDSKDIDIKWPIIITGKIDRKDSPLIEEAKDYRTRVYKGTKLGDLVEKFLKIYDYDGETLTEKKVTSEVTTAYNDLTNSGAYSVDHGLTLKERELLLTTYTKSGWYLKNGGLSDLNSTIRDRLFNISVANVIDDSTHQVLSTDYVKYYDATDSTKKAFITSSNFQPSSQEEYERVILDTDTANFSIIQVEEAVKASKLSTEESKSAYRYVYADDKGDASVGCIKQNEIVHQVIKNTATSGDTYKKNANQYYLLISNIVFSDQSVYDYFKSQYPDLFK